MILEEMWERNYFIIAATEGLKAQSRPLVVNGASE